MTELEVVDDIERLIGDGSFTIIADTRRRRIISWNKIVMMEISSKIRGAFDIILSALKLDGFRIDKKKIQLQLKPDDEMHVCVEIIKLREALNILYNMFPTKQYVHIRLGRKDGSDTYPVKLYLTESEYGDARDGELVSIHIAPADVDVPLTRKKDLSRWDEI